VGGEADQREDGNGENVAEDEDGFFCSFNPFKHEGHKSKDQWILLCALRVIYVCQ
jgi:hypothetical protein